MYNDLRKLSIREQGLEEIQKRSNEKLNLLKAEVDVMKENFQEVKEKIELIKVMLEAFLKFGELTNEKLETIEKDISELRKKKK